MTKPKCINCGRIKAVERTAEAYHCRACGIFFDDDPDEGSDHSSRNPAARLEREDRARAKRAQPRRIERR